MFPLSKLAAHQIKAIKFNLRPTSLIRHASGGDELVVNPKWPRTKEERERAAKKYNLIPEDYEPYPEGEAFGDYPKLKAIGAFNRDRYDDFDDPVDMRFYGEVLHMNHDMYYWERIDPLEHEKNNPPMWQQLLAFFGPIICLYFLYRSFIDNRIHFNHIWKKRTHHPAGTKYYEFPAIETDHHHHH